MATPWHRCAVCWERQESHQAWHGHASQEHSAELDLFGFDMCQHPSPSHDCNYRCRGHVTKCPGIQHEQRLPNYGSPVKRKSKDLGAPVTGRDGVTYVPIPLPLGDDR